MLSPSWVRSLSGILPLLILGVFETFAAAPEPPPWQTLKTAPVPVAPVSGAVWENLKKPETVPVKRVILLIGDGMGPGALEFVRKRCGALELDRFPVKTRVSTLNVQKTITDSAAAGTALSGGYKTRNALVGMNPDQKSFHSIAEQARRAGFAVGIATDDRLTGATPAVFYAHRPNRSMSRELASDAVKSPFDALLGNTAGRSVFEVGKFADKRDLIAEFRRAGFTEIHTPEQLRGATARVFGFVDWKTPADAESFAAALFEKLDRNPKGFFAMIESWGPDHGGHANKAFDTADGVLKIGGLARAALVFAANRPGTLVVVTADHETGRVETDSGTGDNARVRYHSAGHSELPVDLFAAGAGASAFAGCRENTEIPRTIAGLLKLKLPDPIP